MVRRLRRVDPDHPGAGVVGEPYGPVKHPLGLQVVHVRLVTEGQLPALVPAGAGPDLAAPVGFRHGLAALGTRREPDGVDDLHVARAPAQVPGERPRDLGARRLGVLGQQPLGLHDDPRGAEPALRRAGGDEAVRPQLALGLRQPLLGHHGAPFRVSRLLGARHDRLALDQHGTGPAGALGRAAILH
jgi:hypothetical protein